MSEPRWMALVEADARKRLGVGDDWDALKYEWVAMRHVVGLIEFGGETSSEPTHAMITLYPRIGEYKSGDRKGRPKYDRERGWNVIYTKDEFQAFGREKRETEANGSC